MRGPWNSAHVKVRAQEIVAISCVITIWMRPDKSSGGGALKGTVGSYLMRGPGKSSEWGCALWHIKNPNGFTRQKLLCD